MKYSEAVKTLRLEMLMTQVEFADMLGVSFAAVNRWETGKYAPTMKMKRKLDPLFQKYNIKVDKVGE